MVRDFDLIRKIMRAIEAVPAGSFFEPEAIAGEYDQLTVNAHISLLIDAGLLKGKVIKSMGGVVDAVVSGITWEGYEFLGASSDDTIWAKARDTILKPATAVTFDVLLKWLGAEVARHAGLT